MINSNCQVAFRTDLEQTQNQINVVHHVSVANADSYDVWKQGIVRPLCFRTCQEGFHGNI